MNKEQVFELLNFLNVTYPNFEVTQAKIDAWAKLLKDQNPAVVMRNAERYALTQKFAPTVADLREANTEAKGNDFLKKLDEWERDAVGYKPRS